MLVTIRTNDNLESKYVFEPATGRLAEVKKFYTELYKTLKIQGFTIEDEKGKIRAFAGSI